MQKQSNKNASKGSILIAVLAVISLLAFLATQFMEDAVDDLEYRALFEQPSDFRAVAYSYLEIALAIVHEIALIDDGKLYDPKQKWGQPLSYYTPPIFNDWKVTVSISDPCSKIGINALNNEQLSDILEEELDFDFATTQELIDTWNDWKDADDNRLLNGAESDDYLDKDPPYRSPNRPIKTLDELKLIDVWNEEFFDESGQPNALFDQLSALVTTLHEESVNINAATPTVLDYLLEKSSWDAESLFELEDTPYLTQLPDTLNNPLLSTTTNLLKIQVTLYRGGVPFNLHALVETNFNEGSVASSNLPGRSSEEKLELKKGTLEEQLELKFPFKILELSENQLITDTYRTYSQSNLDISL